MRIGVTGHINLTAGSLPLVYHDISRKLTTAGEAGELVGVSCIARGSDSVFAQAVLDAGGHLEVVLPSRNYRERTVKSDHAELFDQLIDQASIVRVMDFDDTGAEAYEAANVAVLDSCERLIAVWDGQAGEPSGTASVVALAQQRGLPVDIVWPEGVTRD